MRLKHGNKIHYTVDALKEDLHHIVIDSKGKQHYLYQFIEMDMPERDRFIVTLPQDSIVLDVKEKYYGNLPQKLSYQRVMKHVLQIIAENIKKF